VVGQVVKFCLEKEISLEELTKVQLGSFHDVLAHAPPEVFAPMGAVLARHSRGGTSPVAVKKQIELARGFL
jgi:argininosuccinate lyase